MLSDWPVGTKRIFIILTTVAPLCLLHLLLSGAIVILVDFPGTLPTSPPPQKTWHVIVSSWHYLHFFNCSQNQEVILHAI